MCCLWTFIDFNTFCFVAFETKNCNNLLWKREQNSQKVFRWAGEKVLDMKGPRCWCCMVWLNKDIDLYFLYPVSDLISYLLDFWFMRGEGRRLYVFSCPSHVSLSSQDAGNCHVRLGLNGQCSECWGFKQGHWSWPHRCSSLVEFGQCPNSTK